MTAFANKSVRDLWLALNNDNYRPLCALLDQLVGGSASSTLPVFGALVKTAAALANSPVYDNGPDDDGVGATLTCTGHHAIGTVGGVAITEVDTVILVTEQVAQEENGLYLASVIGSGSASYVLTRLPGFDSAAVIKDGALVGVQQGTYAGLLYEQDGFDSASDVVGTDPITFALSATAISESAVRTAAAAFTAALAINGQAITNVKSITAKTSTTLTIATGVVTATQSIHAIDTEAAAASDDLDTISGLVLGNWYVFKLVSAARNVVFKHGTGNIFCWQKHDITLDVTADTIIGVYDGTNLLAFPGALATVLKVVLTSDVSGILPVANGGTGLSALPELAVLSIDKTIANAALKTLNATPVEVIPAPAAGYWIEIVDVIARVVYATAAFDAVGATDYLELRYTDASGAKITQDVSPVGFADQASDQVRKMPLATGNAALLTPVAAAAVVAHIATGEWYAAAGGGALHLQVYYRTRTLAI